VYYLCFVLALFVHKSGNAVKRFPSQILAHKRFFREIKTKRRRAILNFLNKLKTKMDPWRLLFSLLKLTFTALVAIISFALSSSITEKTGSASEAASLGFVFGSLCIIRIFLPLFINKCAGRRNIFIGQIVSYGLTMIMNIVGVLYLTYLSLCLTIYKETDHGLIIFHIGCVFSSLMIDNFAQGFHVNDEFWTPQPTPKMENKTNNNLNMDQNKAKQNEKSTNTAILKVESGEKIEEATNTSTAEEAEIMNDEQFGTPSVIFKDLVLEISQEDLDSAKKRLRKPSRDSIFSAMKLPKMPILVEDAENLSGCKESDVFIHDTDEYDYADQEAASEIVVIEPLHNVSKDFLGVSRADCEYYNSSKTT
jgi:hypothetical protein